MSSEQQSNGTGQQEQSEAHVADFGQLAALVHAFIGMMHTGGIARMDVEHGGLRLSLRAHEASSIAGVPVQVIARSDGGVQVSVDGVGIQSASPDQHVVKAPMIGTFYVASAPNEPPYVQPGDVIEEGQTIGIIEAMKIMNEIAADRAGTVIEILVQNAQTVEYGSPLVRIAPTAAE